MVRYLAPIVIALMLLVAPIAAGAQTTSEMIAADLDAWWAAYFADNGLSYSSPRIEFVTAPNTEFCGPIDAYYTPAGYCAPNRTIFVSTGFADPESLAWLPVISHEWGHHIQNLIDTGARSPIESELQADCFAGAFVRFAQDSDFVSPVVSALALQLTQSAGDVWWLDPDQPDIHGSMAERASAFTAGLNGGVDACWL
ncbi:MAG: neutral zinc metallopeptidase [Thermomicrobiales bacterium]